MCHQISGEAFFNKSKLKRRNKRKLIPVEVWQYWPISEEKSKPSALGEKTVSENSLSPYVTGIAESVITMLFLRIKTRMRLCGDSVKKSSMKLLFLKREKNVKNYIKITLNICKKILSTSRLQFQSRLFKTVFSLFCIWTT